MVNRDPIKLPERGEPVEPATPEMRTVLVMITVSRRWETLSVNAIRAGLDSQRMTLLDHIAQVVHYALQHPDENDPSVVADRIKRMDDETKGRR